MNQHQEAVAATKKLFAEQRYAALFEAWGARTARSHEWKAAAFAGYEPTKQDVIVSAYPKSGTTWALQIAYQVGYYGNGDFEHLDNVVPWPDKLIPLEKAELADVSHLVDSPTGIHVIKSHLEAAYLPIDSDARFIGVIRDPKDTLVSMIRFENDFNQRLFDATIPTDAWADAFVTDRFMYQSWPEFIDSWWRVRDRDNVLILLYEEMKRDADASLNQVADFLGVGLTDEQFAMVAKKSGFNWMKANDHRFAPHAWDGGQVSLVRQAEAGAPKAELTHEQRCRIDEWCREELGRIGSDFPYSQLYAAFD